MNCGPCISYNYDTCFRKQTITNNRNNTIAAVKTELLKSGKSAIFYLSDALYICIEVD